MQSEYIIMKIIISDHLRNVFSSSVSTNLVSPVNNLIKKNLLSLE